MNEKNPYTKETEMAVSLYKMNSFINSLFNNTFNSSDYIALNDSVVCLLGNATKKLWLLDLTLDLLDFTSYNYSYSLHKFTTHKPETCLLVWYHAIVYLGNDVSLCSGFNCHTAPSLRLFIPSSLTV
jgi:hypothetical protein